jgi:hypothetical protein
MPSVAFFMLSVIVLNVVMLSVIMLSVVALPKILGQMPRLFPSHFQHVPTCEQPL